jgi:hypothetical protein
MSLDTCTHPIGAHSTEVCVAVDPALGHDDRVPRPSELVKVEVTTCTACGTVVKQALA